MPRSPQTVAIESMLQDGQSSYSIAKHFGVSTQRVSQIKTRMQLDYATRHESVAYSSAVESEASMKSLTIRLTGPVFAALTEACVLVNNQQDVNDTVTVEDYAEELIINRVVELGLLRKYKRK